MKHSQPLRAALLSNAIFAASCALVMLLAPTWVSHLLGLQFPLALRLVGLGLVIFALDLVHQATRPRRATWQVRYATMAEGLWIIGTVAGVVCRSAPAVQSRWGGDNAGAKSTSSRQISSVRPTD